ncbi:hypothetical protein H6F98_01210 [Microcoleus sp. FACHB-SPT15]|nr:hypothetical protein [Microcoleus sp. FACHB-SPT15]MBD1804094.1 hypothetical protein [Microcoleus sp. FACHB-SPT15]
MLRTLVSEPSSECPTAELNPPTTPNDNLAPPWDVDAWATFVWDWF